jgi:anti-sigma B factor antagonist
VLDTFAVSAKEPVVAALNDLSSPATAVVSLPGEIDVTNAAEVLASITAALAPGVTVVIADLTATRFCDSAALRHLLLAHHQVARVGARLRLAIPPRGPVGRVIELTGINRYVPVYATLQLAMDDAMPPG